MSKLLKSLKFLFSKDLTIVPAKRLKELEHRSFVLSSVAETMACLKGMSELETNLEMVLKHYKIQIPKMD